MGVPVPISARGFARKAGPSAALAALVAASTVVRSVFAWKHSVPRLFPDEYIYAALGRSLADGHYAIRGETSHFPGLFEPLLAAPIWRAFALTTAYHVVQVENAVVASLAAVPIFLIGKYLRLSFRSALAAALLGLAVPELVIVAFTSSDAIGYTVALTAILAALTALDDPSPRNQIVFLVFASLAAVTRVQYFVLVPAYVLAAIAVDRRQLLRRHRLALVALAPAAAVLLIAAFGYYGGGLRDTHFDFGYVKWFFLQAFLLAVEAGVILVPGAVAGMLRPRGRRELVFSLFVPTAALLLLGEATGHAANSGQFKERYLFVLLPLLPLAFALYVKRAAPHRAVVLGLSVVIAIAVARIPLSGYSAATFKTDSQFLMAVSYADGRFGASQGSFIVAIVATVGAIAAAAIAFRPATVVPVLLSAAFLALGAGVATHVDLRTTGRVRGDLPRNLGWIDAQASGVVAAVETPLALKQDLLYQLYWNQSIDRELLFDHAVPTDAFAASPLRIANDGRIQNLGREFLLHDFGTTIHFDDTTDVARSGDFVLVRPHGTPAVRFAIVGRFRDGWLTTSGKLLAWPSRNTAGVRVSFRISLPGNAARPVRVVLGNAPFVLSPGRRASVTCATAKGKLSIPYRAGLSRITNDFRRLSVRAMWLAVDDRNGSSARRACSVVRIR
jgi:hypothetical protein